MIQKMALVAKGYKYGFRFDAGLFEEGPFYSIFWIEY